MLEYLLVTNTTVCTGTWITVFIAEHEKYWNGTYSHHHRHRVRGPVSFSDMSQGFRPMFAVL